MIALTSGQDDWIDATEELVVPLRDKVVDVWRHGSDLGSRAESNTATTLPSSRMQPCGNVYPVPEPEATISSLAEFALMTGLRTTRTQEAAMNDGSSQIKEYQNAVLRGQRR